MTTHTVDLATPVPPELRSDFLGKLHYVSTEMAKFSFAPDRTDQVIFTTTSGRAEQAPIIASRIQEVAAKMCARHRGYEPRVLVARRRTDVRSRHNPRSELEANGQLYEHGPGRFSLGPLIVALLEYFESRILQLADRLEAARYHFPALVGAAVLDRCHYLQSFPHALTLTSHLREDLEAIQAFAREVEVTQGQLKCDPRNLAGTKCLLAPTVCFHYYDWLSDTQLAEPRTITAQGHCFRYESGALSSLERLWDFTMREIVFVGPQEYVLHQRDRCVEATTEMLDQWGLSYEIKTATDPFFIDNYSSQAAFQSAFELKYEIRADLPYAEGQSLAVGSFNFHQDFFGRSLNISLAGSGDKSCTGCVGFGMERLIWAFLAQHGVDAAGWPASVRLASR